MGHYIAEAVLLAGLGVRAQGHGTLAGGYVLRETFIEAGKASAKDPRAASRQPE